MTTVLPNPVSVGEDNFVTDFGQPLTLNVLENDRTLDDSYIDSETLRIKEESNGNAQIVVQADGTILYSPYELFFGVDRFIYEGTWHCLEL